MKQSDKIAELAKDPSRLQKLSPRQFEELVAEVLAGLGYSVNLTSATRDGGYDILAVREDQIGLRTSWIVECKRYRADRPVGVSAVRALYGAKEQIGVSNALLVSTSSFTSDARRFIGSRKDIQLADLDSIASWLRQYVPPAAENAYLPERTFQSCFLSYSHHDEQFAEHLSKRLRQTGVEVWYAPEDILAGEKLHDQIRRAIKTFDRLLVLLSTSSMNSDWVKTEIRTALKREVDEKRRVLFPIAIVSFDQIRSWECFDADSGKDLAVEIREYYIPDFTNWRDASLFEKEFGRLLSGLRSR